MEKVPTEIECLRDMRVLIVDDNKTSCKMLTTTLKGWGMRPQETVDGPTALGALYKSVEENDPFGLAIIDLHMPGMDGNALGRAIKADTNFNQIRMILLTSLFVSVDNHELSQSGFGGHLTKPVRQKELKEILPILISQPEKGYKQNGLITSRLTTTKSELPRFDGKKAHLLLVEDNATNQQVALGILAKFGLKADTADDGLKAVEAATNINYDLVLMDCQMPVMDGYEATAKIRKIPSYRDVPIIAMTAHAMTGDREKCLKAGMNDYIAKPVAPLELAKKIFNWLPDKASEELIGSDKLQDQINLIDEELGQDDSFPQLNKLPPESDDATKIWDKTAMMERMMGDNELASIIKEGFLTDIPNRISILKEGLSKDDCQNTELQAHTIKGAAANVCGQALCQVASTMEKAGRVGDLTAAREGLPDLEREFEKLKQAMNQDPNVGA